MSLSQAVVAFGPIAARTQLSANSILKSLPRGVYTSARTVGRNSVFEFGTHVQRTAASAKYVIDQGEHRINDSRLANIIDKDKLYPLMKESVALAIDTFNKEFEELPLTDELRITTLLLWNQQIDAWNNISRALQGNHYSSVKAADTESFANLMETLTDTGFQLTDFNKLVPDLNSVLITHVSPLPRRREGSIRVQVGGAPRKHAKVKDSQWVKDREQVETTKDPDIEEILLVSDNGDILEGTQTNFFAILDAPSEGEAPDGVVYTSSEDVLLGTVRKVVLEVCAKYDIPVMYEAPKLSHLVNNDWRGAFITSTSRLVLPIDEITYPLAVNSEEKTSQKFPPCPLVQFIEEKVALEVQDRSTKVV